MTKPLDIPYHYYFDGGPWNGSHWVRPGPIPHSNWPVAILPDISARYVSAEEVVPTATMVRIVTYRPTGEVLEEHARPVIWIMRDDQTP